MGKFTCQKIHTDHNPADLMTKPHGEPKLQHPMRIMGYVYLE